MDLNKIESLQERLATELNGGLSCLTVELGYRLGLFQVLAEAGSLSPVELATRLGYNERYVREWLECMVAGEYLTHDPVADRFALPAEYAAVLTDPDNPNSALGLIGWVSVFSDTLPKLTEAFRTGDGVPYEDYGAGCVSTQGFENQALFLNEYVANWVPAMPGVEQALQDGGRVADVGCGVGWSAIALAKGFAGIQIDAIDPDERSIIAAKRNAEAAGLDSRVRFHQSTLEDAQIQGPYDLVTIFESLHDIPYPVQVLRRIRELLAPNGSALVADMAVGETLEENTNFFGHICYNFSVLHCLPQAMGFPGTAGTGTVIKPSTMRDYAERAGFTGIDVLPIENPKWRFYFLTP